MHEYFRIVLVEALQISMLIKIQKKIKKESFLMQLSHVENSTLAEFSVIESFSGTKFGLLASFLMQNTIALEFFKNSTISKNLRISFESSHSEDPW